MWSIIGESSLKLSIGWMEWIADTHMVLDV
jgi:hypothetical protein